VESGVAKDRDHASQRPRDRVQVPRRLAAARQRDVERVRRELRLEARRLERLAARVDRSTERVLGRVDGLACCRNLGRRQLADLAQLPREQPLLAEVLHAHGVELAQVVGRAYGRLGLVEQLSDAAHRGLLSLVRAVRLLWLLRFRAPLWPRWPTP